MKYDDDIEHIYLDDEDQHPSKPTKSHSERAEESQEEYKKFKRILIGILIVSTILTLIRGLELQRFIADFMAVFFIAFAALKFIDIESFAHAYRSYDLLAQRIRPCGYALPFIEAFMGFWYLLSAAPTNLNILAILVTGTAVYSASKEIKKKSRFAYTYYDGLVRLPLARVGFIENATMFVLAVVMLFVT